MFKLHMPSCEMSESKIACCASEGGIQTVLSVLSEAHNSGAGVLGFMGPSTSHARTLRLASRAFKEAVAYFPWRDSKTKISGPVAAWHSSFPKALAANLSGRNDLTPDNIALLAAILELNLSYSHGECIENGAFAERCSKLTSLDLG